MPNLDHKKCEKLVSTELKASDTFCESEIEDLSKAEIAFAKQREIHISQREDHWRTAEQRKYVNFIVRYKNLFTLSLKEKKTHKVYSRMSKYIRGRTDSQCRSHHQKMLIKFETIEGIIEDLKDLIYDSFFKRFLTPDEPKEDKSKKNMKKISEQAVSDKEY